MSVDTIELLIITIIYVISYMVAITTVGYMSTWTSDKMGDSTAKLLGYLTFDPFIHIEFIGMFLLVVYHFGWVRSIPKEPYKIQGNWQLVRRCIAQFSDIFFYFILACIGFLLLFLCFDAKILLATYYIMTSKSGSYLHLAHIYQGYSPMIIIGGFLGITFVYISVFLGFLRLIMDGWKIFLLTGNARSVHHENTALTNIIPFLLLIFFSPILHSFVVTITMTIGSTIAQLIGFR